MNNFLLSLLLTFSFLPISFQGLSAQSSASRESASPSQSTSRYQWGDKTDGASDIWWELQHASGEPVSLPGPILDEIADVRHVVPVILPGDRYALWFRGVELRVLDIAKQEVSTLMSLFPETEGISGIAIAPGEKTRIAFVNLNPDRYKKGAKLFVLDLENGALQQKRKYECSIHYGPKGNSPYNEITAGEDFWFSAADLILYRENPMTTDPEMGFGEWDMETYPYVIRKIQVGK